MVRKNELIPTISHHFADFKANHSLTHQNPITLII